MEGQDIRAMIGMRLVQWLLTAAEMCGVFYIFLMFFERRSEKMWNSVLLGIMIVVLSGLTVWQREDTAMYSRYFMLACILAVTVAALAFFRTGFWKGLLATALYFETVYFLDVLSGYLGQLATGDEDFCRRYPEGPEPGETVCDDGEQAAGAGGCAGSRPL